MTSSLSLDGVVGCQRLHVPSVPSRRSSRGSGDSPAIYPPWSLASRSPTWTAVCETTVT